MRRRDFITLLGGTALAGFTGGPPAFAQEKPSMAAAARIPPWGFDLSGIDRSAKPGDDFFRYGNGAWLDRTVIAPDRRSAGVDVALIEAAEQHTREILERGEQGVDPAARADATKFGTFYKTFMDEARIESLDIGPIASILQRIRAASSRDELVTLMGLPGEFTGSIFSVEIGIDAKDPSRYVVMLGQSGLGLPDRDYYLMPGFAAKKAAYQAYVAQLLGMIGWPAPETAATAILAFETAVAEVSWPLADRRDSEKTYNPTSEAALAKEAPFPWRTMLQAASLPPLERVVVSEVSALPKIAAIHARTSIETLKAWMACGVADRAASHLSRRFVDARFAFRSKTLSGIAQLSDRWKRGVNVVNAAMGEAVGRVYVSRYFPPASKEKIEAMVAQIRLAFGERLKRLTWMGPETKSKALEKLARFNVKIGYPDKWRDYAKLQVMAGDHVRNVLSTGTFEWARKVNRLNDPVDRDEWEMTPQTVNAYYNSNLNEIVFPAAILQPPYFDAKADDAVNYGGIGMVIGHEITHGFDSRGRHFDKDGNMRDWWTPEDDQRYQERTRVIEAQYAAMDGVDGVKPNGALTLSENIADVGGLKIAYDALQKSLKGKPRPKIDGLTPEQRFFLSYAQAWRTVARTEYERNALLTGQHSLPRFRVAGPVAHMPEFAKAFSCDARKALLPEAANAPIW